MPALRLGPLRIPWPGSAGKDPYWDAFINRAPSDPRNALQEVLAHAAGGAVNPNRVELHTPEITAAHLKELATFLTPLQRAKYMVLQEKVRRRLEQMTAPPAPADSTLGLGRSRR